MYEILKIKSKHLLLAGILILALFSRLYNLEVRFPFSWDQARDATAVGHILKEGKLTLIGPQAVSDDAFFLGPLWFYLLVPFYFLSKMDPLGAASAVVISGVITTLAIYLFFNKIAGIKVAVIASVIWATLSDIVAWNPMLVPLFEIGILVAIINILEGKKKFIILAFLFIGLGLQLHFQMVFLFIPFIFSIYIYLKKRKVPLNELIYGVIFLMITFLPIFIFDLRHNFLNVRGFLKLFGLGVINPHNNLNFMTQFVITFPKFISTANFFIPVSPSAKLLSGLAVLICSLFGIFYAKISKQNKIILVSTIIAPIFLFSFYRGNLSEYYFLIIFIPILFGFASFLRKIFDVSFIGKVLVIISLINICVLNINQVINTKNTTSLYYQKQAVEYLTKQKDDKIINISFDVPVNDDSGFKYLFDYYKLYPQNIPEGHLWTIVIPAGTIKIVPEVIFGDIAVIRR